MIYKSDLSSFKINYKKKITEALKRLSLINPPILFVVNKKNNLIGTVTDGDIRRYILNDNNLNISLEKIVNKNPFVCNYKDIKSKNSIKGKLYKNYLKGVPLIKSKKLIGAYFALTQQINTTPILIMAGGKGKRLLPLTKTTPKPLLKLNGKPILQHIVEDIKLEKFNNIYVSINFCRKQIKNFFKKNDNFGLDVKFIEEKKPLGTAGSLFLIKKLKIDFENIIVVNADIITDLKLEKILSFHIEKKCLITIGCANYKHTIPFGVIKKKNGCFNQIEEKPTYKNLISAGVYVLNKQVLKKMKKSNYLDMNKLILKFRKNSIGIFPFYDYEDWIDLGSKSDFYKANNHYN